MNDLANNCTPAQAFTAIKGVCGQAVAQGTRCILSTEPGSTSLATAQIGQRNDFNAMLLAYSATRAGVYLPSEFTVPPTDRPKALPGR